MVYVEARKKEGVEEGIRGKREGGEKEGVGRREFDGREEEVARPRSMQPDTKDKNAGIKQKQSAHHVPHF